MTGNPEVAGWIKKHLPRDDVSTWFAREYKKDNSIFNDDNKTNLEHYGSVLDQHKELDELRLDKTHDFKAGMNALKDANSTAEERYENSSNLITPNNTTEKVLPGKHGDWHSLGVGACDSEGGAMGHCGNAASTHKEDNILSLRKEKKIGDKTYHEPSLTFINNNGHLGEMKGKGNAKPTKKYHEDIKNLLLSDHVDRIMGGGYAPNKNFNLNDLPKADREEILAKKPDIDPKRSLDKHDANDFPPKYKKEIDDHNSNIDEINEIFSNYGSIDAVMDSIQHRHKAALMKHPGLTDGITDKHVNDFLGRSDNIDDINDLFHGPNSHRISKDSLKNMANIERSDLSIHTLRNNILEHKNMDEDVGDHIWKSGGRLIKAKYISSKHAKKEHFDEALNDKSEHVRDAAVRSKHFGPEHMKQALNDKNEFVRDAAVRSKHFGPEHMDQALSDKEEFVRLAAIGSKHFSPEHMDQALNDKSEHVRDAVVRSDHFGPEHMKQALNDKNEFVRSAAVGSDHFSPEHMDQALNDKNEFVRSAAVRSDRFSPEHMDQAFNDKNKFVRLAAVGSDHFSPEHMDQALNDKNKFVRLAAVRSDHFSPEHMDQALNDKNEFVRSAAIESKHFDVGKHNQFLPEKERK